MIRNVPFTVKGVLASKGSGGFRDEDDTIRIPFTTAQIRLFGQTRLSGIDVQVDDFRIQNNQQIQQTVQGTTQTLTYLLGGVAAVSLVVGGIGIMNIVLVSVTERTREIGIRLAVGARRRNILGQFLIESVILSVGGGLIGILVGAASSDLLSHLGGWSTLITLPSVLVAFGFAALVGIIFGFYPARRASMLNPIEALRYE